MIWPIASVLVALAGYLVLRPLFGKAAENPEAAAPDETEFGRLLDRKAVVERNLEDLLFEFRMGRMSESDFKELEAGYRDDTALFQEKLERLHGPGTLDDRIERKTAERKKEGRRPVRCPSCGAESAPGKKFCADCGRPLK